MWSNNQAAFRRFERARIMAFKTPVPVTGETVAKMMEYPARLQMSMLAPVKDMAAAIPEGDKEVRVVGYIFGEARGVSYRNNPNSADGSAAEALLGAFEGVPSYEAFPGMKPEMASEARPGLASGVCFLPPAAQTVVVRAVRGSDAEIPATPSRGKRVDQLGVTVPVSLEIGIRKSGSPVGYEWVTRGLMNVKAVSPIDRMRQALGLEAGVSLQARIADGTLEKIVTNADKGDQAAIAAPARKKAGGKKR